MTSAVHILGFPLEVMLGQGEPALCLFPRRREGRRERSLARDLLGSHRWQWQLFDPQRCFLLDDRVLGKGQFLLCVLKAPCTGFLTSPEAKASTAESLRHHYQSKRGCPGIPEYKQKARNSVLLCPGPRPLPSPLPPLPKECNVTSTHFRDLEARWSVGMGNQARCPAPGKNPPSLRRHVCPFS